MTAWMPIDTAPKDHAEVIIFVPGNAPPVFTAMFVYDWSCSVEGRLAPQDDYFGDPHIEPTHWMPLPKPPA